MSEDERQIEKLLRAAATARRTDAPRDPAMPGPMRTRLQVEVTRVFSPKMEAATSGWLAAFWPRLALAATVVLALAVAVFHDRAPRETSLAQQQQMPAPVDELEPSPPPTPAAKPAPAMTPEALKAEQPLAEAEALGERLDLQTRSAPARALAGASAPAAEVLQDFTLELAGEQVEITDADGSVYRGNVASQTRFGAGYSDMQRFQVREEAAKQVTQVQRFRSDREESKLNADKGAETQLAGEAFAFRATGRNLSLDKNIVIEGTYAPAATIAKGGKDGFAKNKRDAAPEEDAAFSQLRARLAAPSSPPLLPSRIIARAQITNGPEVTIDAVAAPDSVPGAATGPSVAPSAPAKTTPAPE